MWHSKDEHCDFWKLNRYIDVQRILKSRNEEAKTQPKIGIILEQL